MEQLSRAMQLHHLLLTSRQPPSRDYLLERLECSLSTFKRLLQTLREQHQIPIVFDHACGGYRYESAPDSLTLPSAFFTESELFALLMAEQLLEQAQPGLLSESIARLRSQTKELLGRDPSGRSLLRLQTVARQSVRPEIFDTVLGALLRESRLQFSYCGIEGAGEGHLRDTGFHMPPVTDETDAAHARAAAQGPSSQRVGAGCVPLPAAHSVARAGGRPGGPQGGVASFQPPLIKVR
mgnify:CR=1 FL=1